MIVVLKIGFSYLILWYLRTPQPTTPTFNKMGKWLITDSNRTSDVDV